VKGLIHKLLAIGERTKLGKEQIEQLARMSSPSKRMSWSAPRRSRIAFRESPKDLTKAMHLLKAKGRAKHTPVKGNWFIAA